MVSEYNEDDVYEISEYFTEVTGRVINAGIESGEIWMSSNRTNGKEYFDSIDELEFRLKMLYSELLMDDDYRDPLEGF